MKLKFKIYQFTNGLGETVFQVKKQEFIGYGWIRYEWTMDNAPVQWESHDKCLQHLQALADQKRKKLADSGRAKLAAKLTLVVIEEVEL